MKKTKLKKLKEKMFKYSSDRNIRLKIGFSDFTLHTIFIILMTV